MGHSTRETLGVSVVIPAYNAAAWLPKTVPRIDEALKRAGLKKAEILVVDDGSVDDTLEVVKKIKTAYPLRSVSQKNSGRFMARRFGTDEAKYNHILYIDHRIYIAPNGVKFLAEQLQQSPERQVWTSHVYLDKKSNVYARFWDVIASLAWRRYFSNPRDYSYGLKEFDYFPKGTTCFFAPKAVMQDANEWFTRNTIVKDLKISNDDTLLIRRIAEKNNININPEFSCTYHARATFRQYLKHVFHRGKVFVDGFLRRDGNRFYWFIIGFLAGSIVLPIVLISWPQLIIPLLLVGVGLWLASFVVMLLLGIKPHDAYSLCILLLPFVLSYGAGIWAATAKIYLRNRQ